MVLVDLDIPRTNFGSKENHSMILPARIPIILPLIRIPIMDRAGIRF